MFFLVLEIVGPKYRTQVQLTYEFGFFASYLAMPWMQYYVRHFRHMQLMATFYELLFVYWIWRLPESPRWQLTSGRKC